MRPLVPALIAVAVSWLAELTRCTVLGAVEVR
jgi:hypothetical protein